MNSQTTKKMGKVALKRSHFAVSNGDFMPNPQFSYLYDEPHTSKSIPLKRRKCKNGRVAEVYNNFGEGENIDSVMVVMNRICGARNGFPKAGNAPIASSKETREVLDDELLYLYYLYNSSVDDIDIDDNS